MKFNDGWQSKRSDCRWTIELINQLEDRKQMDGLCQEECLLVAAG